MILGKVGSESAFFFLQADTDVRTVCQSLDKSDVLSGLQINIVPSRCRVVSDKYQAFDGKLFVCADINTATV